MGEKIVLDACCGSRMMWFDKANPLALFVDIRDENHVLCDGRQLTISPDIKVDFRSMPFPNESFKLVVFDPPHLKRLGNTSWMAKKYGVLGKDWQDDIKKGFSECMRVLEHKGILVFKWNENQITVTEVLNVIDAKPLFGHTTGRQSKTIWMLFIKM